MKFITDLISLGKDYEREEKVFKVMVFMEMTIHSVYEQIDAGQFNGANLYKDKE